MTHPIRLADLSALSETERREALKLLATDAAGPTNGQAVAALARIREFERRYEMTSATLVDRLSRGEVRETAEIAEWLFWINVRRSSGEETRPQ